MGPGWWLAGRLCAITSIGIPFGVQHVKLAALTLAPVGKTIVAKNAARIGVQGRSAHAYLNCNLAPFSGTAVRLFLGEPSINLSE